MPGPTSEPFPNELDLITGFLDKGGSAAIFLDPPPGASLNDFMKKWSVDVGNNLVVDASGVGRLFGAGPSIPLVTNYGRHKITERFSTMTFFPLVRSVTPAKPPVAGINAETLLSSNERSWAETDMKSNQVSFDEKVDTKGPISLAVAATKDAGEQESAARRLWRSDFAPNNGFGLQGNGNLFLNTISWLAQTSHISIRPKTQKIAADYDRSAGPPRFLRDAFVSAVGVLFAGVSVWMKGRRYAAIKQNDMKFKSTAVLFLVFLVLGGYVYFTEFEERKNGETRRSQEEIFPVEEGHHRDQSGLSGSHDNRREERRRNGDHVSCEARSGPG
jgi:hypothetical protein